VFFSRGFCVVGTSPDASITMVKSAAVRPDRDYRTLDAFVLVGEFINPRASTACDRRNIGIGVAELQSVLRTAEVGFEDAEAKRSRYEIWKFADFLFSERSLEFSFLTQNAPSDFVILEEMKKYAGGQCVALLRLQGNVRPHRCSNLLRSLLEDALPK